jgi:pyruvate carboxylase subunit B
VKRNDPFASVPAKKEAKNVEEAKAAIAAQKVKPITGKTVEAPLPGRIVDICVKVGDKVKRGDTIAILEAMKMENSMTSNYEGTVKQILVEVGQAVAAGTILAEVE